MKKKLLMTLAIVACAALLVVGSVAGTLAYLRSMASVSNTFNYGKVYIQMTETAIDTDGKAPVWGQRKDANTYLLMPDTTYVKDPVIHVDPASQDTYMFVKIDNGIYGLGLTHQEGSTEAERALTIHNQMLANGWKVYTTEATDGQTPVTYDNITTTTSDSGVKITTRSTVYYLSIGAQAGQTDAKVVTADYQHTLTQQPTGVDSEGNYTYTPYAEGDIPTFATFTTGTTAVTQASMLAYINAGSKITVTTYAVQAEADDFDCYHDAANVFLAEWASAIPAPAPTPNA